MAEADTLRMLTRSGGVRLVKRVSAEIHPEVTPPASRTQALPTQMPIPVPEAAPKLISEPSSKLHSPSTPEPGEIKKEPPAATLPTASIQRAPGLRPPHFRRRARLTDLARMILPAKREESSATIVPPSFPVEIPAGTVLRAESPKPVKDAAPPAPDVGAPEKSLQATPSNLAEPVPGENAAKTSGETPATKETVAAVNPPPIAEPEKKPEPIAPEKVFTPEIKARPAAIPATPAAPLPASEPASATPKAEPATTSSSLSTPPAPGEKREFFLANGERILGKVLSETPDSIYLEHATLGVLTLPRTQIAKRLVELILINGDRIVGDIVAETPECLFVRHASLGMLTVPQAQRSTRVVEAILKDGDRIVGEVLAETETYTVIRSATLGTVTVQHRQLAMLNRKVEQVALKTLPPAPPAIENKPSA
jgi:RNase P/RNase MRP subunit p29